MSDSNESVEAASRARHRQSSGALHLLPVRLAESLTEVPRPNLEIHASVRPAYIAQRNGREYVVMDEKEVGSGERILGAPAFSVAGNRLAYTVKRGDSMLVVVDGNPGKSYAAVGDWLQFTRDGRVVYLARDSLYYVVGGVEGRGYPFIAEASVRLSENGEHQSDDSVAEVAGNDRAAGELPSPATAQRQ